MSAPVRVFNATSAGAGAGTTEVITVDATGFAAGDVLVMGVFNRRTVNVTLASVADSKGNTWAVGNDGHSSSTELVTATAFLTTALVNGDTITLTWSATSVTNTCIQIHEWAGIASAAFVDANPAVTLNGGSTPNGPAVTTSVHDIIVAFFGSIGAVTVTGQAAGWTYAGTQCATSGPTRLDSIYIDEATPGTYTPSVTYTGSTGTRQAAVALKLSGAPVNTVAPSVTGTLTTGQTLTATSVRATDWTDDGTGVLTYQWARETAAGSGVYSNIGGATSSTHVLVAADAGLRVRCDVTDTDGVGATTAHSNAVGPIRQTLGPQMLGYYTQ